MDILFNELSLTGQFDTREQFVSDALSSLVTLLNEIDISVNVLYKKYDFYTSKVTTVDSIHDILIGNISRQFKEVLRFKNQLRQLFDDPYWEDNKKHASTCSYECNGVNVCGESLAEACERDKVIISFQHLDFSNKQLSVIKNKNTTVLLDNLVATGDYYVVARQRGIIVVFSLKDSTRFRKTNFDRQGQMVYKETKTGCYWYLDNLHKNHYEVFDSKEEHIGVADIQGNVDTSKRVSGRKL